MFQCSILLNGIWFLKWYSGSNKFLDWAGICVWCIQCSFFSVQSPTLIYTITFTLHCVHRAQNWMFQQDGDKHPSIKIEVRLVNMKQKCICLCLSNATTHFQTNLDISWWFCARTVPELSPLRLAAEEKQEFLHFKQTDTSSLNQQPLTLCACAAD